MRVFTYAIVYDAGVAPNYDPPATTLAICKPKIRLYCEVGDLIIAFSGKRLSKEPHSVRWAGVVTEKLSFDEYWRSPNFQKKKPGASQRPDNIYRPSRNGLAQVPNSSHSPKDLPRDISGGYVIVTSPSWRFGDTAPILPADFGLRMFAGRRGHRVAQIGSEQWKRLKRWLDRHRPNISEPITPSTSRRC
jgi:hypothetical protein